MNLYSDRISWAISEASGLVQETLKLFGVHEDLASDQRHEIRPDLGLCSPVNFCII